MNSMFRCFLNSIENISCDFIKEEELKEIAKAVELFFEKNQDLNIVTYDIFIKKDKITLLIQTINNVFCLKIVNRRFFGNHLDFFVQNTEMELIILTESSVCQKHTINLAKIVYDKLRFDLIDRPFYR